MRVVAAGLLVVLVVAANQTSLGTAPQTPSQAQPAPRFKAGVDLVVVDVSVLDRDRRPVRGLAASDFTLLEDGRPQRIQTFSAVDMPDIVEPRAPWMREVAPDVRKNEDDAGSRIILIVLDDAAAIGAKAIPNVKEAASAIIDNLEPGDLAAVVFTSDRRGGQEFTYDRVRLRAAVNKFAGAIPGGAQAELARRYVPITLRGLAQNMEALPQHRKALFLISTLTLNPHDLEATIMVNNGRAGLPAERTYEASLIREFLDAARRANVNVYGINPYLLTAPEEQREDLLVRFLENPPTGREPVSQGKLVDDPGRYTDDFLASISYATGGFPIIGTNSVNGPLAQAFRENRSYYLLGYAPTNGRAAGRFRGITVRVNRPDVTVRARQGYFEPHTDKKKRAVAPSSPLTSALAGVVSKTDVALQMSATPLALSGKQVNAVAIVLGFRAPGDAGQRTIQNLELLAAAYDANSGRLRASRRMNAQVTVPAGTSSKATYEMLMRLDLRPGRYQLRVAATSKPEGKSGSVYYDLDVPDFAKSPLSVSGLVLGTPHASTRVGGDSLASLIPLVPTTRREFGAEEHVFALLRLYQGGKGTVAPATVRARIVDQAGFGVFEAADEILPDRFSRDRSADYRLELPLGRLEAGEHLLTVEARLRDHTTQSNVRLLIR